MNTLPSDTNESVVDIFVLSGSSSVASPLKDSLEEGGYRVTLFTDGTQLLELLQTGIPNLLICDATTEGSSAFDMCRTIKADDSLWMIPVLILSRTNGLADLLSVLDCNADNFIAYPCDPPFLISLIEGMLITPVERQTPDMVKTQFKIQHDDKVYVVTADRRKLLELLLSSFETAVNISSDHSQTRGEAQQLSRERTDLLEKLAEHVHTMDTLRESLHLKEQEEKNLSAELGSLKQEITEKSRQIATLEKDRVDDRALIAAAEEHIRTMLQQKEEMLASHHTETSSMEQQASDLSAELDARKGDINRLEHNLEAQTSKRTDLEKTLEEVLPQKEKAENTLRALRIDAEQLSTDLAEKTRLLEAVSRELEEIRNTGVQLEQDLGTEITGLRETVTRQTAMLDQLKSELGIETKRAISAYESLTALQSDKEQSEATLRAGSDSLKQQLAEAQKNLEITTLALTEEEKTRATAEAGLVDAASEREKLEGRLKEFSADIVNIKANLQAREGDKKALELQLAEAQKNLEITTLALTEEKKTRATAEAGLVDAAAEREKLDGQLKEFSAEIASVKADLEVREADKKALEQDLARVSAEKTRTEDQNHELTQALDEFRTELETEKSRNETVEKRLQSSLKEKEEAVLALRSELGDAGHDLEAASVRISDLEEALKTQSLAREEDSREHNRTSDQLRLDLETRSAEKDQLTKVLGAATSRIETLEEELRAVAISKEKIASEHARELEAAKKTLEFHTTEMDQLNGNFAAAAARIATLEGDLKAAALAREETATAYQEELDTAKQDIDRQASEIQRTGQEIDALTTRIHEIQDELRVTTRSGAESERQARSLGDELDQVKADLENERRLRREDTGKLQILESEKERLETEVLRSGSRAKETGTALSTEEDLRRAAEERADAAEKEKDRISAELDRVSGNLKRIDDDYSAKIENLSANTINVLKEQKSLEQQLESVTSEKSKAEQKLAILMIEIEQARIALADEWLSHMNADEQLAAAESSSFQLQQAEKRLDDLSAELQQARAALADEWENHMNADERAAALDKKNEQLRQSLLLAGQARDMSLQVTDSAVGDSRMPVLIRPKSTSLSTVDIPVRHSVHEQEIVKSENEPEPEREVNVAPVPEPDRRSAADIPLEDLFEDVDPVVLSAPPPVFFAPEETDTNVSSDDEEQQDSDERGESRKNIEDSGEDEEEVGPDTTAGNDQEEEHIPSSYLPGSGTISFSRQQWFDLFTWARHADALSSDQRMEIIRMGRLIQRGRKLTQKQDARVREMIELAQSFGYRLP